VDGPPARALSSDPALLSGEGELATYEFNRHLVKHRFCISCGIQSFAQGSRPSDGAAMAAVNVRCLEGVNLESLRVKQVDGKSF
jgi:hypothetical protein